MTTFLVVALGVAGSARAAADPKTLDKCQATLKKAGAKFIGKKQGALAKCTDGVFKCIQTVDETADAGAKRTTCITKARGGCLKSLATITPARQAFVDAVTKACSTLDATQVTDASGLGYVSNNCSEFGTPVTNVATLAECLARQHNCLASRIFQFAVPRALELIQFTPPDAVILPAADAETIACLKNEGGIGADVNDLGLGKAIVKCQKAIEKVGTKLANGRLTIFEKCVDALFTCAQTKSGDDLVTCRDKARAGCQKTFDKSGDQSAGLAESLGKPCGEATLFAAFRAPAGGNLNALLPPALVRAGLVEGCSSIATIADYQACLLVQIGNVVDDLLRFQSPRAESLLADVGCDLGTCTAVPTPTVAPTPSGPPGITQIINASGDGTGHTLDRPVGIAVDGAGTVYLVGENTDNAFKITSGGAITQIIDASGDGAGHGLDAPGPIAVDGTTVYLGGTHSNNVFKITSGNVITQIMDASGDGAGHTLDFPGVITVGGDHTVYVASGNNSNVFKITSGGVITRILSATGDGAGHTLETPSGIGVDAQGTVYVSGLSSTNVFKVTSGGTVTRILSATGDGAGNTLDDPAGIAVDGTTVYVSGSNSDNVFKITAGGTITQIMDQHSDGASLLSSPGEIRVDANHNVYVAWIGSSKVFKITSGGTITRLISGTGDGAGHTLTVPYGLAVDGQGKVYVTGYDTDNAFKITP